MTAQYDFNRDEFGIDRETEHEYLSGLIVIAVTMSDLSDGDSEKALMQIVNDRIVATAPTG